MVKLPPSPVKVKVMLAVSLSYSFGTLTAASQYLPARAAPWTVMPSAETPMFAVRSFRSCSAPDSSTSAMRARILTGFSPPRLIASPKSFWTYILYAFCFFFLLSELPEAAAAPAIAAPPPSTLTTTADGTDTPPSSPGFSSAFRVTPTLLTPFGRTPAMRKNRVAHLKPPFPLPSSPTLKRM